MRDDFRRPLTTTPNPHLNRYRRRMRRQEAAAKGCFGLVALLYLVYLLVVVGIVVGLFFLVWKYVFS